MLKRITLFLYVVINLNIYSQVVIKDEIILDEVLFGKQELESAGLSMPFYGKVKEEIICGSYVTTKTRLYLIVNGQNNPFGPCTNWECAGYPATCFCVAGNPTREVEDVPAYSGIEVMFEKCIYVGGQHIWQTLEYQFQYVSETNYHIIVTKLEGGTADVGSITFTETPPPACCPILDGPCVNLCPEPFNLPALEITQESNPNICNEISDPAAGAFKGLYWNLRDGEELRVEPCQSPSTGEIKFIYATNFSNNIYLPYNLELCPNKVAYLNLRRIDDMDSFLTYLAEIRNTITLLQACNIRKQIIDHKGIDENGNQTEDEFFSEDGIWLTAHTLAHEEEHRRDYENEINNAENIFYEFYNNYSVPCSTYRANTENAKLVAEGWYKSKLTDFSNKAQSEYDSKLNEVNVNGRPDVLDSITSYLSEFDKFCKKKWGEDTYWNTLILCN